MNPYFDPKNQNINFQSSKINIPKISLTMLNLKLHEMGKVYKLYI